MRMNTRIVTFALLFLVWTVGGPEKARAEEDSEVYEVSGSDYEEQEAQSGASEQGGGAKFDMPPFSIRIDPFNWLLEGRLGVELEVGVWKFISFEMVPVFVVNDSPPIFNFAGEPDNLTQSSNGLGPISGSSFGLGFWLNGKPLQGYVLRVIFTNYGYTYETKDGSVPIDKVNFTERRLFGMFGSHSNFGPLTIATGIGLGVELNRQQRCYGEGDLAPDARTSGCKDKDEQLIAIKNDASKVYDLNGWAHPIYLAARISIGIVLDL
jgi:hypothetical protein